MESYKLCENEVVLYSASVKVKGKKGSQELQVTNLNLIITTAIKKLFSKAIKDVAVYSLDDIKRYKDKPYCEKKADEVTVYLLDEELEIEFETRTAARKFCTKIMDAVTGKNIAIRGMGNVKKAVNEVDETLGINSVGIVGSTIKHGVAGMIFHGTEEKSKSAEGVSQVVNISGDALKKLPEKSQTKSEKEKIKTLKQYKDLLDKGVITEEEFNAKKEQLLD